MADSGHLKILKQGVEVWNAWRVANPEVRPDLMGATLFHAPLSSADLRNVNLQIAQMAGAYLKYAHLGGADLRNANLGNADLSYANLIDADLGNAFLISADLEYANLERANLEGVMFYDVNLQGASLRTVNLQGASLGGALFGNTTVGNVDLTQAIALDVLFYGPSTIGVDTLEQTATGLSRDPSRKGEIESFLRGCGLPDRLLDTFRLLVKEFYSCFISHSHHDNSFASRLHRQLQARGIRCWHAERDLEPGERILDAIHLAIRLHDRILLCCSESSLNSWWVKDEIRKALERELHEGHDIIIPLLVDRYLLDGWQDGLASDLRSRLAVDFIGWEHDDAKFAKQFERVVKALRTNRGAR